ncbi:hypothetical protein J4Q44_G00137930 [Coregonus suidteri]|uniref:Uncharacterized protein n=1 Tax=Coregonus suidteri TaxID=861788 RepID=A0AAN8LUN8_9TELE
MHAQVLFFCLISFLFHKKKYFASSKRTKAMWQSESCGAQRFVDSQRPSCYVKGRHTASMRLTRISLALSVHGRQAPKAGCGGRKPREEPEVLDEKNGLSRLIIEFRFDDHSTKPKICMMLQRLCSVGMQMDSCH